MANSASEIVQMAFNLMDGGARCAAGRAVDEAIAQAEAAEAKKTVENALESAERDDSDEGDGAFAISEEKLDGGKVRLGCSFSFDPDQSPFAASGEEAAEEDRDSADLTDKNAGQATDSAEGLTPVADTISIDGFAIAEDAVKKSDVKTDAANCKAQNVLKCPYHGPEHMEKKLLDYFKQQGIVEVDASVESAGKGKYMVWAVCDDDEKDAVKQAMVDFMQAAGVNMDKKGVHFNPDDEQTVASFKVDWLDKNAKSNSEMHNEAEADVKEEPDETPDVEGEVAPALNVEPVQPKIEQEESPAKVETKTGKESEEQDDEGLKIVDAWSQAMYMLGNGTPSEMEYEKLKARLDEVNGEQYVADAIANGIPQMKFEKIGLTALHAKLSDLLDSVNKGDGKEVEGLKKDIKDYVCSQMKGIGYTADNVENLGYWTTVKGYAKKIDELAAVHLNGRIYQFDKLTAEQKADAKKHLSKAAAYAEMGDMLGAKMEMKHAEKTLKVVAMKHDGSASETVAKAEADAGEKADNETKWNKNAQKLPSYKLATYVSDIEKAYKIPEHKAVEIVNTVLGDMSDADFTTLQTGEPGLTASAFSKMSKAVEAYGNQAADELHTDGIYPVTADFGDLGKITDAYNAIKDVAEGEAGYGKVAQSKLNLALGTNYHDVKVGVETALGLAEKLYDATNLIGQGAYSSAKAKLHQAQQIMHNEFMSQHGMKPIQKEPKSNFDIKSKGTDTEIVKQALASDGIANTDDITLAKGFQGGSSLMLFFTKIEDGTKNPQKAENMAKALEGKYGDIATKAYTTEGGKYGYTGIVAIMDKNMSQKAYNDAHEKSHGVMPYDLVYDPANTCLATHIKDCMVASGDGNQNDGYTIKAKDPKDLLQNVAIADELNSRLSQSKVQIVGNAAFGYAVKISAIAPKMDANGNEQQQQSSIAKTESYDFGDPDSLKSIPLGHIINIVDNMGDKTGENASYVFLKSAHKKLMSNASAIAKQIEDKYGNVHACVQHMTDTDNKATDSLYIKVTPKMDGIMFTAGDHSLLIPSDYYGKTKGFMYKPLTDTIQIKATSESDAKKIADSINATYINLSAKESYQYDGFVTVSLKGHDGINLSSITGVHYSGKAKTPTYQQPSEEKESTEKASSQAPTTSEPPKFGGGKAFLQSSVAKYKTSDPALSDKFAQVLAKLYA